MHGFRLSAITKQSRRSSAGSSVLRFGNPGDVKPVGEGISEMRISYGPGYRVYFKQTGKEIVLLLCGGDKSTQDNDIRQAKRIAAEL